MSAKSRAKRERRLVMATTEVCGCAENQCAQHGEFSTTCFSRASQGLRKLGCDVGCRGDGRKTSTRVGILSLQAR
jgi:hypothetical protein